MISNLRTRLSKHGVGVVAEGHKASIGNLLREEIFQPELLRLWMYPGGEGVATEAMDSHNTKVGLRLAKADCIMGDRGWGIPRRDLLDGGRRRRVF
jgi:hypothetical protein